MKIRTLVAGPCQWQGRDKREPFTTIKLDGQTRLLFKSSNSFNKIWTWLGFIITMCFKRLGCASVTLKDEQTACVKAIYEEKDVFLWLPTGLGKSMCYEVLPFVLDDKLEKRDRPTGYWSSTKMKQERIHVERRSFTTICTYVALRYLSGFVIVRHRGPSHLMFT